MDRSRGRCSRSSCSSRARCSCAPLGECLERFLAENPAVGDVSYATTPPRVIVQVLRAGRLRIGNLEISARVHLFISPPQVRLTLFEVLRSVLF
jgi:hypothetical protein